jgi:hypothetical protein
MSIRLTVIATTDVHLTNDKNEVLVSYGPRRTDGDQVVPAALQDIQFFGVYRHPTKTMEAEWFADVIDHESAEKVADLLFRYEKIRHLTNDQM